MSNGIRLVIHLQICPLVSKWNGPLRCCQLCKLVEDPAEDLLFTHKVLPTLKRIITSVADPECRSVCERAHETLFMAAGSVELSEDETKVE